MLSGSVNWDTFSNLFRKTSFESKITLVSLREIISIYIYSYEVTCIMQNKNIKHLGLNTINIFTLFLISKRGD